MKKDVSLGLLILLVLNNALIPFSVRAQATPLAPASCQKIGVNSAAHYTQESEFYQKAANFGMGWTIEIADYAQEVNQGNPTVAGINRALANHLTPIVRIGVGSDSGGFIDPAKYALFLKKVSDQVGGKTFYAVAGPNEPEYEHWIAQEKGQDYNVGDEGAPNYDSATGIPKLGQLLADYMNAVINSGLDQNKIKLLSPSLSVTAWSTVPIIKAMKNNGANFPGLSAFSGTSYSGNLGAGDIRIQIDKVKAELPSLPIVFTEYQDGGANLTTLKADVDLVKADSNVIGALLFNAFNTNTGWSQFALSDTDLAKVLGPECINPSALTTNKTVRPAPRPSLRPCTTEDNSEFHPLRPYPGEPCDPLIPRSKPAANYPVDSHSGLPPNIPLSKDDFTTQLSKDYQLRNSVAFSCGNSLTPNTPERFDVALGEPRPDGASQNKQICRRNGNHVTCEVVENFDLTLDLRDANIPILGNTQTQGLTDAQKMTEYLSWYLNGTVQSVEQKPNPSTYRLINFSGPLQKLLPFDLKNLLRNTLVDSPVLGQPRTGPSSGGEYHNYIVGCKKNLDFDYAVSLVTQALPATLEGIVDTFKFIVALVQIIIDKPAAIANILSGNFTDPALVPILTDLTNLQSGPQAWEKFKTALNTISLDAAEACSTSTDFRRLADFIGKLPPDPTKYDDFAAYWRDFMNWRGKYNVPLLGPQNIPNFFGSIIGLEFDPFNAFNRVEQDVWAQLFQNIPFSSLEDTTGEVVISVSPDTHHANQQGKDVLPEHELQPLELRIKRQP